MNALGGGMAGCEGSASLGRRPFVVVAIVLAAAASVSLVGCAERDAADEAGAQIEASGAQPPPGDVVDSIFPIEEEIRRFREGLPEVTKLTGGAMSRDELVERFLAAVERADSAALAPLLLTRAEFGYLYYPHTIYTRDPYELSPALLWFQMQNLSNDSLTQIFLALAGHPLHATGYRCETEPEIEGPNRVWSDCRVTLDPTDSQPKTVRLFGSIMERDGVFKLVSYAAEM
jgi:hypothetical protein